MACATQAQPNHEFVLAPCIRRLNNQLRVDFAADVHSTDEKRKRKATYSIYDETAERFSTLKRHKMQKKSGKTKFGTASSQKRAQSSFTEEGIDDISLQKMISAAASLAELRTASNLESSESSETRLTLTERIIENITKAHACTIAAKDDTIKSVTAALAAKEELVRVQAMLIAIMQQHSGTEVVCYK
jgi:hypothetical protein